MAGMKTILNTNNKRLDISEEKNSKLEEVTIEIIKKKTQKEKKYIKMNRASVSSRPTSHGLIFM